MQTRNRFFTDIARVASSAAGGISGLKEEIERTVRQRVELFLTEMNLANREEFDALKSMVSKLRIEQEQLNKKISTLESKIQPIKKPKIRKKRVASKQKTPKR